MSDEKDEARERLLAVMPYLRHSMKLAADGGDAEFAIISRLADKDAKLVSAFRADEFMKDLELVLNAPPQTEEDDLTAEALRFLHVHGLTVETK